MSVANQCQIVLGTSCMEVTREPVASNSPELFPKSAISSVLPIKINAKSQMEAAGQQNWNYRFPQMVMVTVTMNNADQTQFDFKFDVQEVTNQAGWTGNLAGQQQCVDDINTWLAT